jgi:putative PIN family toxin of toxin-antitoxin system
VKVVIDTNVLVSALLFGGIPGRFVALWKNNHVTPLVSADIMAEYLRVLAYPKFRLTGEEISHLLMHEILPWFETVAAPEGDRFVPADPADDKFIWCALAGGAECIISGDDHLLACAACPVSVLTPTAFLEKLINPAK